MAVIQEGIILNEDNTLSFGNYHLNEKLKITDFNVNGDLYSVRTYKDITRISKNGKLLLETVPGATIHNLSVEEYKTNFSIEGFGDTLVTLELEASVNYSLYINDVNIDKIKTNLVGKINFSTTLSNEIQNIKIEKI